MEIVLRAIGEQSVLPTACTPVERAAAIDTAEHFTGAIYCFYRDDDDDDDDELVPASKSSLNKRRGCEAKARQVYV